MWCEERVQARSFPVHGNLLSKSHLLRGHRFSTRPHLASLSCLGLLPSPRCPVSSLCHCYSIGTAAVLRVLKSEKYGPLASTLLQDCCALQMKVTGIWKDFCISSERNFWQPHYPSYLTSGLRTLSPPTYFIFLHFF